VVDAVPMQQCRLFRAALHYSGAAVRSEPLLERCRPYIFTQMLPKGARNDQ